MSVAQVDPATTYLVRQPAAHPVWENWRVRTFRQLLQQADGADPSEQLAMLGEIMYQVSELFFPGCPCKPCFHASLFIC